MFFKKLVKGLFRDIAKDMKDIARNKRASYDYVLTDHYEAGLALTGGEVKSIKTGHASLKGAFVTVHGNELYLINALIPRYRHAGTKVKHEETRSRKLLLRKREIRSLIGLARTEGLTLVPIRLYTKKQLVKLEFAIGKGKKTFDKRQSLKKREDRRRMEKALKGF